MSIFSESLRDYVQIQLKMRERVVSQGNNLIARDLSSKSTEELKKDAGRYSTKFLDGTISDLSANNHELEYSLDYIAGDTRSTPYVFVSQAGRYYYNTTLHTMEGNDLEGAYGIEFQETLYTFDNDSITITYHSPKNRLISAATNYDEDEGGRHTTQGMGLNLGGDVRTSYISNFIGIGVKGFGGAGVEEFKKRIDANHNKTLEGSLFSHKNMTHIDQGAFHAWTTQKQAVLRMCSGVNIREQNNILTPREQKVWTHGGLAKDWVLQGGVPHVKKDSPISRGGFPDGRAGYTGGNHPSAYPGTDYDATTQPKGAYGDPRTRSDADDGFGIVPMPGIKDAVIKTKTAYGSLREAKVNFICHNRRQLEILELLYMRPGFPIMLEWGWTPYISNSGKIMHDLPHLEEFFNDTTHINEETSKATPNLNYGAEGKPVQSFLDLSVRIKAHKETTGGNYDGFVGYCKNFNFKARPDGGYNCSTEIISMGEILTSLKSKSKDKKGETNEVTTVGQASMKQYKQWENKSDDLERDAYLGSLNDSNIRDSDYDPNENEAINRYLPSWMTEGLYDDDKENEPNPFVLDNFLWIMMSLKIAKQSNYFNEWVGDEFEDREDDAYYNVIKNNAGQELENIHDLWDNKDSIEDDWVGKGVIAALEMLMTIINDDIKHTGGGAYEKVGSGMWDYRMAAHFIDQQLVREFNVKWSTDEYFFRWDFICELVNHFVIPEYMVKGDQPTAVAEFTYIKPFIYPQPSTADEPITDPNFTKVKINNTYVKLNRHKDNVNEYLPFSSMKNTLTNEDFIHRIMGSYPDDDFMVYDDLINQSFNPNVCMFPHQNMSYRMFQNNDAANMEEWNKAANREAYSENDYVPLVDGSIVAGQIYMEEFDPNLTGKKPIAAENYYQTSLNYPFEATDRGIQSLQGIKNDGDYSMGTNWIPYNDPIRGRDEPARAMLARAKLESHAFKVENKITDTEWDDVFDSIEGAETFYNKWWDDYKSQPYPAYGTEDTRTNIEPIKNLYNISNKYIEVLEARDKSIGFIQINYNHLIDTYNKMKFGEIDPTTKKRTINADFNLYKFFKQIWEDVSTATLNNHKFILQTEHETDNRIRVIDVQIAQKFSDYQSHYYTFDIQSANSVVKDFSFTSTISDQITTAIAISAQAPHSMNGLEMVTFAAFNKNVYNRFTQLDYSDEEYFEMYRNEINQLSTQWKKLIRTMLNTNRGEKNATSDDNIRKLASLVMHIKEGIYTINAKEPFHTDMMNGDFSDNVNCGKIVEGNSGNANTRRNMGQSAIIPLKFNCKIEGIGGLVIGNIFKINPEKLPKAYGSADIGFIILSESQKITVGQDWTTDFSGQLYLLESKTPIPDQGVTTVNTPTPVVTTPPIVPVQEEWLNPSADAKNMGDGLPFRGYVGTKDNHYVTAHRYNKKHSGADIRMHQGTELVAPVTSRIIRRKNNGGGYGYYCAGQWIDNTDPANPIDLYDSNGAGRWLMAHMSEYDACRVGDVIEQGDKVGLSGGSKGSVGAGNSCGPHLHYEIGTKDAFLDPHFNQPYTLSSSFAGSCTTTRSGNPSVPGNWGDCIDGTAPTMPPYSPADVADDPDVTAMNNRFNNLLDPMDYVDYVGLYTQT